MISLAFILTQVFVCWAIGDGRIVSVKRRKVNSIPTEDLGEPLFLTPYLEKGDLKTARHLCKCGEFPDAPKLESHSGFFTVNKDYNSNIFFWLFPALNKNVKAPVLLWLQGGPGVSGLFGLFTEHGPYVIQANMTAKLREYNWAETFHLLYVDNPVGTGYSFTDDDRGYVTNQNEMADDMYEFLQQFFILFPEYSENDFFIAGESYAGKYVPSLAHKIHSMGKESHINLRGISVGNGMCDPETMMDYGDYLYNIGLIDEHQADVMRNLSAQIVQDIRSEDFLKAVIGMDKLIMHLNIFPDIISMYQNFTGLDYYYNYLVSKTPKEYSYFFTYIEKPEFRRALHVGDLPFQNGKVSKKHLLLDIMKSAKPNMTVVMDNYRVLVYNGQLDVIIPYPLTVNFLKTVKWKYADEYRKTRRDIWYLKNSTEVAGYVRKVGDFYEVMVRNAGHLLPSDQPKFAFDLMSRFIFNEPYA